MEYEDLIAEIGQLLADKPEAKRFVIAYGEYIEMIDDMVDEPKDISLIDRCTAMSQLIFSSEYWQRNSQQLSVVEQLIHTIYFNVVQWESAPEAWKRRDAKALSHVGYFMLFAVLLLETRDSSLVQRISLRFMEKAHKQHLHDLSEEENKA